MHTLADKKILLSTGDTLELRHAFGVLDKTYWCRVRVMSKENQLVWATIILYQSPSHISLAAQQIHTEFSQEVSEHVSEYLGVKL